MKKPLILILVQNLPLPGDRRVWLECKALRDHGYRVAAITPAAPGDPSYEVLEDVHLFKYTPPKDSLSKVDFIWEFLYCWVRTFGLTLKVWRTLGRPAVIQSCNPPDTFFLIGLLLRPFKVRFVFDQHDLNPEVYESRFGKRGFFHRALVLLERATYATAAKTIVTNESYAAIATSRGGQDPADVVVVRTGPDTDVLRPGTPSDELRRGRKYLVHYHGVMGPQDGVDVVIETIRHVVYDLKRTDISFSVLGKGDEWGRLRKLVTELNLDDYVYMPGRVSDEELFDHLSTADIGLSADPPSPLNDVSTMNKTMEYMAFGVPVLAFDLKETKFSAGDAAIYVEPATPEAYGKAIVDLLADPERRKVMSALGTERAQGVLDWRFQKVAYTKVFEDVLS